MRIDLGDITAIPGRMGLGFVTDLLNSVLGVSSDSKHHHKHHHGGHHHCEESSDDYRPGRPSVPVLPPGIPSTPILPPTPTPTPGPSLDDELEELLGRQVQVNTPGGQLSGIMAAVRRDYLVLNNGVDFLLVPTRRLQGVVTID